MEAIQISTVTPSVTDWLSDQWENECKQLLLTRVDRDRGESGRWLDSPESNDYGLTAKNGMVSLR